MFCCILLMIVSKTICVYINKKQKNITNFSKLTSNEPKVMAQLITSILCVFSFIYVCKRSDDGWLTRTVSYLGWILLMGSRVMLFCLIVFYIHYWLILFCLIHILCFSIWIFNIAIESYAVSSSSAETTTNRFSSLRKRASLALLVFFFFGLSGLLYWPIMFQLKGNRLNHWSRTLLIHFIAIKVDDFIAIWIDDFNWCFSFFLILLEANRPLKYLIIISLENMALLGIFFYFQTQASVNLQVFLIRILYGIAISTFCGVFLILFYVFCKPKYTDQVVLFEIREIREANQTAPTFNKLTDSIKVMIIDQ